MKIKSKSRAFIGLTFIILLFLGGRFFYDYLNYKKELEEERKWQELIAVEHESLDNYKIIEDSGKQMIINESIGISFQVPNSWNIEKEEGTLNNPNNYIIMSSPDLVIDKIESNNFEYISKGCWIGVYTTLDYFEYIYIKNEIEEIKGTESKESYEDIIEINNHLGLREIYNKEYNNEELGAIELLFSGIYIAIPLDQKTVITVHGIFSNIDKDICVNEFDNLIKNISLNESY